MRRVRRERGTREMHRHVTRASAEREPAGPDAARRKAPTVREESALRATQKKRAHLGEGLGVQRTHALLQVARARRRVRRFNRRGGHAARRAEGQAKPAGRAPAERDALSTRRGSDAVQAHAGRRPRERPARADATQGRKKKLPSWSKLSLRQAIWELGARPSGAVALALTRSRGGASLHCTRAAVARPSGAGMPCEITPRRLRFRR